MSEDHLTEPDSDYKTPRSLPFSGVWSALAVMAIALVAAILLFVSPQVAFLVVVASAIILIVAFHRVVAAYVIVGVTPLIAGIDRGLLIPVLRPNEALALLVAVGLLARSIPRLATNGLPALRLSRIDFSIILMALASSLLPLLWLSLRGKSATTDDLLYALTIWKLYALYLIVRTAVRTEQQVRRCLAIGMASAAIVAVIAILQSLKLFGVPQMLSTYFTHFGNTRALEINRGSSTLSLPAAVADLMILNIAIAWAWLRRGSAHPLLLRAGVIVFVFGALASGQIAGVIALVLCAGMITYLAKNLRPIITAVPVTFVASIALWPVISRRIQGFSSPEGLPPSWLGRIANLRTYFFPELFSDFHFVLGVRPAARVLLSERLGYVWIESGYTWLLWSGGIPLLLSFVFFSWTNIINSQFLARTRDDSIGTAATGCLVGLVVVAVLMVFDPHISYRGSADMLFSLLALTSVAGRVNPVRKAPGHARGTHERSSYVPG